ncbi:MAG: recombination protein RecR [Deltaproteobacteria bacterium]|nr:recombination protein RecR [Deltaproteobacteria bacterium]
MVNPLDRLVHALCKLPGVGEKSATRYAFHLLRSSRDDVRELAEALLAVTREMRYCAECLVPSPTDPCRICRDHQRDRDCICVVEEPADVTAIEKSGAFRGVYHILHGALSPLEGVGPDALKVHELIHRLRSNVVGEVILATNATVEGEATAAYVAQMIRPMGIRITRLASGMPAGAEVEYVDARTLAYALHERRTF